MWDKRYNTTEYVYGTAPNDFLSGAVTGIPQGRTLCIAEGEGRNAVFLAEHGHQARILYEGGRGMTDSERSQEAAVN